MSKQSHQRRLAAKTESDLPFTAKLRAVMQAQAPDWDDPAWLMGWYEYLAGGWADMSAKDMVEFLVAGFPGMGTPETLEATIKNAVESFMSDSSEGQMSEDEILAEIISTATES